YSVMLRDLKLLLCKGNDAYLILFCSNMKTMNKNYVGMWIIEKLELLKSMLANENFQITIINESILKKVYKPSKNKLPES
ncbi:hypothetical protein COBT_003164, partial [Conglomerata obtusa]